MNKGLVRVKVVNVQRRASNSDGYEEREILDVADAGGKMFKLTRFRHDNEYKIAEGHVYEGQVKKSNNPEYNDTFQDVFYIKGGFDGVRCPFWPEPANNRAVDDRTKSILTQSDMRTAAILIGHICGQGNPTTFEYFADIYNQVKAFREEQEQK